MQPYYEPWQGSLLDTLPYGDIRLLIVGESSYEREQKSTLDHLRVDTQDVANGAFSARYSGFWRFIQRSVTGQHQIDAKSQSEFWNRVALVNLVQRPMSCKDSRPNYEDYARGAAVLGTYVELLKPDAVIVFSKEAWTCVQQFLLLVPEAALVTEELLPPTLRASNVCWSSSRLGPGSSLFLLARHPSSRPKIAGTSWHALIAPFIQRVRHNNAIMRRAQTHARDGGRCVQAT